MNQTIQKIRSLFRKAWEKSKQNPRKSIAGSLVVLALIGYLFATSGDNTEVTTDAPRVPSVSVASVATLSSESDPLVLLGEVRSVSQADLRTQKPGEVTRVYVTSGQFVPAGAILAEVSNASERASVLSAQGMLAGAEAQLDKIKAGARGEDKASTVVQAQAALVSLQSAKDSARSAYSQAYSQAQDAVIAKADQFFSNAYTVNPSFRVVSASFDERQVVEKERVAIGYMLDAWKEKTETTIPDASLDSYLANAQDDLERIKSFLNQIGTFVSLQETNSDLAPTQKVSQQNVILGAQSSVDGARSAVNGARTGLANALSAAQVTSINESKIITGERSEDIAVVEAGVTQARGALAGAYAALENTLIRTPIPGVVTTLNIAQGDYVGAQQTVAVVANEGALEIEAFVSDVARSRITVGMPAKINGTLDGTVTSVSPGLDPVTKKSRVTIGITGEANLANGSFVEIALQDQESATGTTTATTTASSEIRIPISSIKVLPRGFAVFTVSSEGVLQAQSIEEGPIVGSKMIIPEGLTPDMLIVTDVRGLSEGDVVDIAREQD